MVNDHEPLIVNAIGHLAGAIVFGIFLVLALRGAAGRRARENWLSVASAGLAWTWNAASFTSLILTSGTARWALEAASFSSLSLLPAVLLHLSLNGKFRGITASGYLLSVVATTMHLCERLLPATHLHKWALWVITAGFGVLTLFSAVRVLLDGGKETRGRTSQLLASMCLLLFAVTFSHFGAGHPPRPWSTELVVHHAGIPVALLILLQDYRFVFLDAFVRFLANVFLAAILAFAGIRLAVVLVPDNGSSHPLADTLAVAGLCGLLILFAYLRGIVQRWFTMAVFRRSSIEGAIQELRLKAREMRNEAAYLTWAAERLAAVAGTHKFEILESEASQDRSGSTMRDLDYPSLADDEPWLERDDRWNWAEAVVPIRLSQSDVRNLLLGRRRGGRRYLSEDLRALNHLARVVAEEVERFRATEMQRLVSEAELRALHSQINPHFLFNALNTIYGIIPREAAGARRTVLNLADIFRYFLQSDKILIPLSEELKIVRAYLDIERLRLGPRLQTSIQVDKDAEQTLIPVLSVQPLVENAIKHGLSMRSDEGWLRLTARSTDSSLTITVEDSGAGPKPHGAVQQAGPGVGLANVTRRLQLCFGPDAGVRIQQGDFGTRVQFSVPLSEVPAHQ
ncbi:MAG TPA: histidine kinase [Bryobacteraceae bacterium]|nr:histidine kinase [Bryobacteraceae bacterium]